jgi:hypothetical protein
MHLYRLHYSESNIMMLNIMAIVFNRTPEKAPFFIKPLLRSIQAKAEQGYPLRSPPPLHPPVALPLLSGIETISILWTAIKTAFPIH